ncbi:MAG TPA: Uma2 family endonuclease [Polyangiaceae bacterium]|jgi:Uma2 family endonuclease
MVTARSIPPFPEPPSADQHFVIRGVPWKTYVLLREALDVPGLRMTFIEGALEFMSPSPEHERIKTMIARLVEMFAAETDAPLYGYGSTTFRRELKERGLEPDECYCVGADLQHYPDVAIEVVMTSGGLDKLPVYRGLEVKEVWFWVDGRGFDLHALGENGYERIARSHLVPNLDFEVLARFVPRTDQPQAIKEFRATLRSSG